MRKSFAPAHIWTIALVMLLAFNLGTTTAAPGVPGKPVPSQNFTSINNAGLQVACTTNSTSSSQLALNGRELSGSTILRLGGNTCAAGETSYAAATTDLYCPGCIMETGYSALMTQTVPGVNFAGAQFTNAKFNGSSLSGANFASAQISTSNFRNSNLPGANFASTVISNPDFRESLLPGANFASALISNSNNVTYSGFLSADLQGANFTNAKIYDADFSYAKLQGANFSNATIGGLIGSIFIVTKTSNIKLNIANDKGAVVGASNFGSVVITSSSFYVQANNADFMGALLLRLNAAGANFQNANFSGAYVSSGVFSGANFKNANLSYIGFDDRSNVEAADFGNTIMPTARFYNSPITNTLFYYANMTGVIFFNSPITNADFSYANLTNAKFSGFPTIGGNPGGSPITNTNFTKANLTNAEFNISPLTNVNMQRAIISNVKFYSTSLNPLKDVNLLNATGTPDLTSAITYDNVTCPDGVVATSPDTSCTGHFLP